MLPSHGVIKINYDWSFLDVNAKFEAGFVTRNEEGSVLFDQGKLDIYGLAEATECLAARLDQLKARDLGLEGDCFNVISYLNEI